MTEGWVYCFSNISMPGILKVGMTLRTPEIRLSEANHTDTWRPPTRYKIELAKKVSNAAQKEKTLHLLLEQYTYRYPGREFFDVSPKEVSQFLDLMDGEMWVETRKEEEEDEEEEEEEEEEDTSSDSAPRVKTTGVKGCRDMAKCFTNGQRIRHTIGINKTWTCTYDSYKNVVICSGSAHTLNKFAVSHYKSEKPDRKTFSVNAWKECECEVNGTWISTFSLPG